MPLNVPGLYFMSWYDVSVGPNLAVFNHVRKNATGDVANQQWAVIAPVTHCGYTRATENTMVGERNVGDARLDYAELTYGFFANPLRKQLSFQGTVTGIVLMAAAAWAMAVGWERFQRWLRERKKA